MIQHPGPLSALVALPVDPNPEGLARVLELERRAREAFPDLQSTVPAFNRLLLEGRARSWEPEEIDARIGSLVEACLREPVSALEGPLTTLPVCYDEELGPDLADVARSSGLETRDVVELHASATYVVLATGFAPGFAYLGDLDERLAVPRRPSPRARVEAGSVGVADRRTGVYPSAGPGGWQLIGRVPSGLFRDAEARVALFEPGGRVRFRVITRRDYEAEAR
ncbi:MAG: 5-oxoprolinase subunit PxpB [Gemmatimonadetes bacterium]|nr:5-oxoprolinase subunit PxpB [Gemmatimonadota bacterium]